MDLKKLQTRSISGIVYIGIIIGCLLWGIIPFSFMGAFFAVVATLELKKITGALITRNTLITVLDCWGVGLLSFGWMLVPLWGWLVVMIMRLVAELYLKNSNPVSSLANSMMTQLYIGLPIALMVELSESYGAYLVLAVFIMIWLNDTGAFIVGSTMGRHRLFERISPKKSWEGFFGGLVFNIIAAILYWSYGNPGIMHHSVCAWISLAVLVTLFSTWGDLIESLIKRSLHIKDSGNIIPGHGGILDRIDSLLLVMPATFVFMTALEMFF